MFRPPTLLVWLTLSDDYDIMMFIVPFKVVFTIISYVLRFLKLEGYSDGLVDSH